MQFPRMESFHFPDSNKVRKVLSTGKVIMALFLDKQGMVHLEFIPKGATIKASSYCETLKRNKDHLKIDGAR
ncbi:hypothetical protein NPIL_438151, partial [Nephila pilipes]